MNTAADNPAPATATELPVATVARPLYTSLPLDPRKGWQPTAEITGWWGQYAVTGPYTHAVRSRFGTVFYGAWDAEDARRYGESMGDGRVGSERGPAVITVEPYYYNSRVGHTPPAAVHPLCTSNSTSWRQRPAGSEVTAWTLREPVVAEASAPAAA